MNARWKHKVITLKHGGGAFKPTETPDDVETTATQNHAGSRCWELVSAACVGPGSTGHAVLQVPALMNLSGVQR